MSMSTFVYTDKAPSGQMIVQYSVFFFFLLRAEDFGRPHLFIYNTQ